jgi:hypothetical protein
MTCGDIGVVIPAFNVEAYIGACLRSLLQQTDPHWLAVVVDDGSTDATAAQVNAVGDERVRLVRGHRRGVSAARNIGLSRLDAPLVMFLDGDDWLHPEAFAHLRAALGREPAAAAAFGAVRAALANGAPYPQQKPAAAAQYPSGDVLEQLVAHPFLANGGQLLARTAAVRATGGFDTSLSLSEDWEFWCRLALQGPLVFAGAEPPVLHLRHRPGSASAVLSARWDNHLPSLEKVAGNTAIRERVGAARWATLRRAMLASQMWEAGRVNFCLRNHAEARRLMLRSLALRPTPKRLALFAIAEVSRATNRSLVSRLRFRDHDLNALAAAPARTQS